MKEANKRGESNKDKKPIKLRLYIYFLNNNNNKKYIHLSRFPPLIEEDKPNELHQGAHQSSSINIQTTTNIVKRESIIDSIVH